MSSEVSEEFKQYALFSVRADRFFAVVNSYGMNHDKLKFVYKSLPKHSKIEEIILRDDIDQSIKDFLLISATTLDYVAKSTGIFSDDETAIDNKDLWEDALNYSFYTCYCFQWSLFENFTKKMLRKAINANVFAQPIREALEGKWRKTKSLLDYIDSGNVFGSSPFVHMLPVEGWSPGIENITYANLDQIRELRNEFIHYGLESPVRKPENIMTNQSRYQHSMWILRLFAQNIDSEVQRLIDAGKPL